MPSRKVTKAAKAAPPAPKAPETSQYGMMGELGGTGLQQNSGVVNEEWLHSLQGKNGVRAFREMSENDPIARGILYAMEMLLKGVTWTVEPGGDTPADEEAAEWLGTIPEDMSHTMSDFISEWMAAPTYGFAPFEVCLKLRNGDNAKPGLASKYNDGKIGVRKLAIRHPSTLDRWQFDEEGGIQAMVQRAGPKWTPVVLPIETLLLFRCLARKGNPEGQSLLRGAFTSWYTKKKLEAIEAIGIERNMAGFPLIYYPPEWQGDTQHADKVAEVQKIARNVKADEQAGLALPALFDAEGNRVLSFELVATSGKQGSDVSPIIERYARQMAMSVLADVILLGHEKVGSFSLAESKTNLFTVGLGALLDGIRDVLNRHLVPRLMRLNGFKLEQWPQFQHSDLETVDLTALGDFITKLASAGAPLFPSEGGELERHLYRVAGLPIPEGDFPAPRPRFDPFADPNADPDAEKPPVDEDEDDVEKQLRPVLIEYGTDGRPVRLVPQ